MQSPWDPEFDAPLGAARVHGTPEEQAWCSLTYLAGIYAINKRYGRGADAKEIRRFALKAGYRDGRAVTAWSKGAGATQNDEDKKRWITKSGLENGVMRHARELGIVLPDDLTEPWGPPTFD